ncbi:hypothetical protein PVAP13_8KG079000 [Panicum virgatum]|uniref:Uncharacterized protein n=1 Tax=Panicum virgatum TaxID=38727 RepID=A0A8T0PG41_PANVG|nr:hypothetical protein PVAP13_8KG079000 [Panicum virgatum]
MAASSSSTAACRILIAVVLIVATLFSYGEAKYVCMGPCDNFYPDCSSWCRNVALYGKGGNCLNWTPSSPSVCCCRT